MRFKEYLSETQTLPPELMGVKVKKKKSKNVGPDYKENYYEILIKGKKVGELTRGIYGAITGTLWKRNLPYIDKYTTGIPGGHLGKPEKHLKVFFQSKTGMKWLDVARKQGLIK